MSELLTPNALWEQIESNAPMVAQDPEANSSSQARVDDPEKGGEAIDLTDESDCSEGVDEKTGSELVENGKPLIPADTQSLSVVIVPPTATLSTPEIVRRPFPNNLPIVLDVVLGHNGRAYSVRHDKGNRYVLEVGSRALNTIIRDFAQEEGHRLRKSDLNDINELILDHAERAGIVRHVWYRIAPIEGGVEIDAGDVTHARIRITAGKVEIIESGSETLFFRTPYCLPMAMPQEGENETE